MKAPLILLLLGPAIWLAGVLTSNAQDQAGAATPAVRKDYDMRQLVAGSVHPEPVQKGRKLWVQRCAHCHDGLGQPSARSLGPTLDAGTVKTRGEEKIRQTIATGSDRMPGFRYTLQPAQIEQLVEFLKTVATAKPEAR